MRITQMSDHPESVTLRGYQKRIVENVKNENSLVVLPTGSGKTLIAATIIAHVKKREDDDRMLLMLVPKRILVEQQAIEIKSHFPHLYVRGYCKGKWLLETEKRNLDVIVATPESILRLFTQDDQYSFCRCSLIIFDEIHHTNGSDPYVQIASAISAAIATSEKTTQILGLTAMVTYEDSHEVAKKKLATLLHKFNITNIQTAPKEELEASGLMQDTTTKLHQVGTRNGYFEWYQPEPVAEIDSAVGMNCYQEFSIRLELEKLHPWTITIEKLIRQIESVINFEESMLFENDKDGKRARQLLGDRADCNTTLALTHLYEIAHTIITSCERDLELSIYHWRMCEDQISLLSEEEKLTKSYEQFVEEGNRLESDIRKGSNRLSHMCNSLVDRYENSNGDVRAILFTTRKISVYILQHALSKMEDLGLSYKLGILCGAGWIGCHRKMDEEDHRETIDLFRQGKINLLIATTVAEEGLNVPDADFVIRYDAVQNPVSFVQGRGRARMEKSEQLILGERPGKSIKHFQKSEEMHHKLVSTPVGELTNKNLVIPEKVNVRQKLTTAISYLSKREIAGDTPQLLDVFGTKMGIPVHHQFQFDEPRTWRCETSLTVDGDLLETKSSSFTKSEAKRDASTRMLKILLCNYSKNGSPTNGSHTNINNKNNNNERHKTNNNNKEKPKFIAISDVDELVALQTLSQKLSCIEPEVSEQCGSEWKVTITASYDYGGFSASGQHSKKTMAKRLAASSFLDIWKSKYVFLLKYSTFSAQINKN